MLYISFPWHGHACAASSPSPVNLLLHFLFSERQNISTFNAVTCFKFWEWSLSNYSSFGQIKNIWIMQLGDIRDALSERLSFILLHSSSWPCFGFFFPVDTFCCTASVDEHKALLFGGVHLKRRFSQWLRLSTLWFHTALNVHAVMKLKILLFFSF